MSFVCFKNWMVYWLGWCKMYTDWRCEMYFACFKNWMVYWLGWCKTYTDWRCEMYFACFKNWMVYWLMMWNVLVYLQKLNTALKIWNVFCVFTRTVHVCVLKLQTFLACGLLFMTNKTVNKRIYTLILQDCVFTLYSHHFNTCHTLSLTDEQENSQFMLHTWSVFSHFT